MRLLGSLVLLLTASCLGGCGGGGLRGERLPVSGTVTLDGKPLAYGLVEFSQLAERGELQTAVVKEGKFALDAMRGLPAGNYSVCLLPYVPEAEELDRLPAAERQQVVSSGDLVPERYRRRGVFTAEVKPSSEATFQFEMKRDL